LLVIAGPGAGKTHVIVEKCIYLIRETGIKPESDLLHKKKVFIKFGGGLAAAIVIGPSNNTFPFYKKTCVSLYKQLDYDNKRFEKRNQPGNSEGS
jgi:hypothetical protein